MQNSIMINDAMQVRPVGIDVNEGLEALKCAISREASRLWATKSDTFSTLCEETVTYGDVVKTMVGLACFMAFAVVGGYLFGGEVM